MPVKWNDKADAKLLIGILTTSTPKIEYSKLAEFMGPECTEIAVKRRIQRLRGQVNAMASDPTSTSTAKSGEDSTPTTPQKRSGDALSSVQKSPSKKAKVEDCDEDSA